MGGPQDPALSFSPKLSQGKDPMLCPLPWFSKSSAWITTLLDPPSSATLLESMGDSQTKTMRDGFIQTTQSKHQPSPRGPHLSFAFSSFVSPFLFLSCHLPLSRIPRTCPLTSYFFLPQKPLEAGGYEGHSKSPRGRVCVNKLTQVGNWKGERQNRPRDSESMQTRVGGSRSRSQNHQTYCCWRPGLPDCCSPPPPLDD